MLTAHPAATNEGQRHADDGVPEVRLPKVDLGQVEPPKVELPKVELPKVELSQIELPKVDFGQVDLPREIEDRLPNRRRANPLPLVVIGLGIVALAAWLVAWSPLAPRIRSAVSDARARLGIDGESSGAATIDEGERLDEYDVDPLMFGEPEPLAASDPGPAFEPDRSAIDEPRPATIGG